MTDAPPACPECGAATEWRTAEGVCCSGYDCVTYWPGRGCVRCDWFEED